MSRMKSRPANPSPIEAGPQDRPLYRWRLICWEDTCHWHQNQVYWCQNHIGLKTRFQSTCYVAPKPMAAMKLRICKSWRAMVQLTATGNLIEGAAYRRPGQIGRADRSPQWAGD